jgi:hypothetical protein
MLTLTLVIVGWISLYVVVRRMVARSGARLREDFQQQIDGLASRVEVAATTVPRTQAVTHAIAQESVSIIAGAAAGLSARKIQVRPVKPTPAHPVGDPWAQLGREGVHSSHDIAQRGH